MSKSMDFLIFVTSSRTARYWDRSEKLWTENPILARGYKSLASGQAQMTRITKHNPDDPFTLPDGESLKTWGVTRRDKI